MNLQAIKEFVIESNAIERIFREPTQEEIDEFIRFMSLSAITIEELKNFVSIYQPDTKLRDQYDMNVRVGRYIPPFGGPDMPQHLNQILNSNLSAYKLHFNYEKLHPFMDCNGRSGRALWAWKMKEWKGSFLLNIYYQHLSEGN